MHFIDYDDKDTIKNIILQDLKSNNILNKKTNFNKQFEHVKILKSNQQRLFNVPLQNLSAKRVQLSGGIHITVPEFLSEVCQIITKSIDTEGLFRKAGSKARQNEIKAKLNTTKKIDRQSHVIDIANILKLFFHELPEPLIPYSFHDTLLKCLIDPTNADIFILMIMILMPLPHLNSLMYFFQFLQNVAGHFNQNKMDAYNLAVVLTPTIMPIEKSVKIGAKFNQRHTHHVQIIKILIENADKIGVLPSRVIDKLPNACSTSSLDNILNEKKCKKKRRSGSLTRVFGGLRNKISGKNNETNLNKFNQQPDLIVSSTRNSLKRKSCSEIKTDKTSGDFIVKPRLSQYFNDPVNQIQNPLIGNNLYQKESGRTSFGKWFYTSTPKPALCMTHDAKLSYLSLSKLKRQSLTLDNKKFKSPNDIERKIERRWSLAYPNWGKKKKAATLSHNELPPMGKNLFIDNKLDDEVFYFEDNKTINNLSNINEPSSSSNMTESKHFEKSSENSETAIQKTYNDDGMISIPKSEYEEIKNRVSALEKRVSQEINLVLNDPVINVQTKYEETLEQVENLQACSISTEQLTKKLNQNLKIRRWSGEVIRSPSARKIGSIRRRSKELQRNSLRRSQSLNSDKHKINLKRGKPNTINSGLTPKTKGFSEDTYNNENSFSNLSKIFYNSTNNSKNWIMADQFFKNSPNFHNGTRRESILQLRNNAGSVQEKVKIFEKSSELDEKRMKFKRQHNFVKDTPPPPPKCQLDDELFYTPMITPYIKKSLGRTPKSFRRTQLNSIENKSKTPMKAIHRSPLILRRSPRILSKQNTFK